MKYSKQRIWINMSNYEETFEARGSLYNQAMRLAPQAREPERAKLLDLLGAQPGEVVVDAPAGGGYVAEKLRELVGSTGRVICVEPSAKFAEAIGGEFETYNVSMAATGMESACADRLASLAGLHHFDDNKPVFQEWARLLKPGGTCAVADVLAGSRTDHFLNEFVHEGTPGGHCGYFFTIGDLRNLLEGAGFVNVREEVGDVSWEFNNRKEMVAFVHLLFGLSNYDEAEVAQGLETFLNIKDLAGDRVRMGWELLYATGKLPNEVGV